MASQNLTSQQLTPIDFGQIGPISKPAYLTSTFVLFGICILCLLFRLTVRAFIQRQFITLDDFFIIVGTAAVGAALGLMCSSVSELFLSRALTIVANPVEVIVSNRLDPTAVMAATMKHLRNSAIYGTLCWGAINSVKFSFLVTFRRLTARTSFPLLNAYWWFVLAYTIVTFAFGITVYYVPCPINLPFNEAISRCSTGVGATLVFQFSIAQLILDVLGDLMIVFIPLRLIWQVKIPWSQKLALLATLCLSVVLIIVTSIRASKVHGKGIPDTVWVTYWTFISAEIGLILSTSTAFRALFVAGQQQQANQANGNGRIGGAGGQTTLSGKVRSLIARALSNVRTGLRTGGSSRQRISSGDNAVHKAWTEETSSPASPGREGKGAQIVQLKPLPTPHSRVIMTGIRTFIDQNGRDSYVEPDGRMGTGNQEPGYDSSNRKPLHAYHNTNYGP